MKREDWIKLPLAFGVAFVLFGFFNILAWDLGTQISMVAVGLLLVILASFLLIKNNRRSGSIFSS